LLCATSYPGSGEAAGCGRIGEVAGGGASRIPPALPARSQIPEFPRSPYYSYIGGIFLIMVVVFALGEAERP
jgi:hypothetical protein